MASPTMGHRDYNRLKYYAALKTQQKQEEVKKGTNVRSSFLEAPEHMLDL